MQHGKGCNLAAPELGVAGVGDHGRGVAIVTAHAAPIYELRDRSQVHQCLGGSRSLTTTA